MSGKCLIPPTIQCIKPVTNNQYLEITWENSTDATHEIYTLYVNSVAISELSPYEDGAYISTTRVPINSLPTANTFSCKIIATDPNTGEQCESNIMQSILLTAITSADSSMTTLTWEAPSTQISPTWDQFYYVYKKREFEADFDPTPIANISINASSLSYTDTSDVCNNYISYQIGIRNSYDPNENPCSFRSNIERVFVVDHQQPTLPILDSVSVTEDNQLIIGFHAPEPYMYGYPIYYKQDGLWLPEDTIFNATFWTDPSIDPSFDTREYSIAVLDSCVNSSIKTGGQSNMNVFVNNLDACQKTANIQWSTYANLKNGILHYRIFLSEDHGATYQCIDSTTNNSYTLTNLNLNQEYRVFIQVVNNGHTITASSNRKDFNITADESTDFTYIRSVSVIDNAHLRILVHTSGDTLPFSTITLQRSSDGETFSPIATLNHHGHSDYEFTDSTADFNNDIYYYQTYLINACDYPTALSNISHNILLSGESTTAHESILHWDNYETWNGDVRHYTVSRKSEADSAFLEFEDPVFPAPSNDYYDDVSTLFETGSKFTYYVTAKENLNEYGFEDESISNQVTLEQSPSSYLANSFTPDGDGLNDIFMPYNSYVSYDGYSFTILSRFGQTAFHTTNPYEGWNGEQDNHGILAPAGVYVYRISYILPSGKRHTEYGSVTLIR